jgi:hypothetical protein
VGWASLLARTYVQTAILTLEGWLYSLQSLKFSSKNLNHRKFAAFAPQQAIALSWNSNHLQVLTSTVLFILENYFLLALHSSKYQKKNVLNNTKYSLIQLGNSIESLESSFGCNNHE